MGITSSCTSVDIGYDTNNIMEWFKFYGSEFLGDPKMLALSACDIACWITLLSIASASGNGGKVKHITEERLMMSSHVDPMKDEWKETVGVLRKFSELGMIETDSNGEVTICNWAKRQESYLTGAERQARWRERQKRNAVVTPKSRESNARIEENRIEKKRNTTSAQNARKVEEASKFSKLGADLIKEFEKVDPKNKRNYANKTQRTASDFLIEEYGFDEVVKRVKVLPMTNKVPYFPKIYTPYDLQEKWGKLQDAVEQERAKKKSGSNFIL